MSQSADGAISKSPESVTCSSYFEQSGVVNVITRSVSQRVTNSRSWRTTSTRYSTIYTCPGCTTSISRGTISEAGKLNGARPIEPHSNAVNQEGSETTSRQDNGQYDELYFKKETESFAWQKLPLAFLLYLTIGTLYYDLSPANGVDIKGVLGFYQSISIGFSIGLSPRDPNYIPEPWFSSAYILVGAHLIALNLVIIGRKIQEKASNAVFEGLKKREDYENDMSRENPLRKRFVAFVKYNAPYLLIVLLWVIWLVFIIVWCIIATNGFDEANPEQNWGFAYALYFAVSLCSSAGAFSLPSFSPVWAYGFAAVSMMIGVPLMALAVSSVVIMLSQGHHFKKVKKAAWEPVQLKEIKSLKQLDLCNDDDEEQISKSSFVLLGLLRMGQDRGIIKYLADAYDASEERGGVMMTSTTNLVASDVNYSRCARACFLNCSDSGTKNDENQNESGQKKRRLSRREKQWSVAAIKDGSSPSLTPIAVSQGSSSRSVGEHA
eukprot:CCRYP_003534-RB/>CCRYP_003534-RB protein AED:0.38 eAED:0.39 QI:0/0.75/0.8/1/0.75/0.6/5/448/492